MTRYALGLGSNLGDRLETMRRAVDALGKVGVVVDVSSIFETEPVGGPEQPPYLNAVVLLDSALSPDEVLIETMQIESDLGRIREGRWGPRTIDIDLVCGSGMSVDRPELTVPHPRAAQREFVLRPLTEVWPDADLGEVTAADALSTLESQGVELLARSWVEDERPVIGSVLVGIQFGWLLGIALAITWDGALPDGSATWTRIVGAALCLVGGGLALVASRRLGPGLTPNPEPKRGSPLVETGPFALARHPIYGGVTLFILGASLLVASGLAVVLSLALVPFFVLKSTIEERRLRLHHSGYSAYRRRVRRRLIPFLL